MRAVVVAAIVAGLPLAGCMWLKYESGSWGGGSGSWSSEGQNGKIHYSITYLTFNDRRYCVLVSEAGGGGCSGGPPASGSLNGPDGREVKWQCDTPNGRSGQVSIGSRRFELAKGAVFLISLRNEGTPVEQVAIDTDLLQGDLIEDRLKVAAQSNERLAAFLKGCETPK
jgi:hypothetical protein